MNTTHLPPLVATPDWLLNLTKETTEQSPLPLFELLPESAYYPAAGTGGHDVEMLSPYAPSFVHVDYSYGESEVRARLLAPQCSPAMRWLGYAA